MIHTDVIKGFSEDELAMLSHIIYSVKGREVSLAELKSYKYPILKDQILSLKDKVNETGMVIYQGLCQKLNIPL